MWEAINEAFDVMPLSALIDDKILCVHGGIFPADLGGGHIESINKIPSPLRDPEKESPLAWEILWNDPAQLVDLSSPHLILRNFVIDFSSDFHY